MTHREQQLLDALESCRKQLRRLSENHARLQRAYVKLQEEFRNVRIERDAADIFVGEAMEAALAATENRRP